MLLHAVSTYMFFLNLIHGYVHVLVLFIYWYTGPDKHLTSYNIDWLLENTYHDQHRDRVERVLWNKAIMATVTEQPMVPYEDFMETEDGLKEHVKNLMKFGFSVVTQVNTLVYL